MIGYAQPSTSRIATVAGNAARTFSSGVAWTFGAIPLLAVVGGLIYLLMSPETAYIGVAAACVLIVVAGKSARAARRKRGRAILVYLAQAVHLNLPISTLLLAAAKSERPPIARRIERLRIALEDGSPIGSALAVAVPQVPQRVVDLANSAERNGRLSEVLSRLLDEHYPIQSDGVVLGFYGSYSLILFLVISIVITVLSLFVMPKFEQICHDFKVPVPALTHMVMDSGLSLGPLICLIALIGTLIVEGRAFRQLLSPARPRVNPLRTAWDHVIWYLPIFGTLIRNRGLADACGIIADGLEAGRPIEQAISEAVQPNLNAVLRRQVDRWSKLSASGVSLPDAASGAGLPAIVSGLVGSAVRAENLPGALRFLSRHYESSFSRTAILLHAASVPALVLALGSVVLAVSLALFEPLVLLIQTTGAYSKYW